VNQPTIDIKDIHATNTARLGQLLHTEMLKSLCFCSGKSAYKNRHARPTRGLINQMSMVKTKNA